MISVVIPTLNESRNVAEVVRLSLSCPLVSEVIVVDDGSTDGTPELARAAGAKVVISSLLGKGASMRDGLELARHEIVAYLDGDLSELREDLLECLTAPIREHRADFVKARFSRRAGRVTALTARPLLRIFFPELAHLDQPLAGIIAGRRSLLRTLQFETDYGVDVGLLIDAAMAGAAIAEVDVGRIAHDSHSLEVLSEMATQVARTILDRADRCCRLNMPHVREIQELERHLQSEPATIAARVGNAQRLAIFDMDGVLFRGRFVEHLAWRTNRTAALKQFLDHPTLDAVTRSDKIAALFADVRLATFEQAAREMPLSPNSAETIVALRAAGFCVGIVTDSYFVASEIVRRRVFADFSLGHSLKFRNGRATGELVLSPAMFHPQGCPQHPCCKQNALRRLIEALGVEPRQTLAVGDGENDVCMFRAAEVSIAYRPKSPLVTQAATFVAEDLAEIPRLAAWELGIPLAG